MIRSVTVAVVLAALLLIGGCSAKNSADTMSGASEEWRLRNLEEKSLQFQNAQMELTSRLNTLEGHVHDLKAASTLGGQDLQPQESAPKPLMTSDDLPTPGPVKKQEQALTPGEWDKYPDATAPAKATAPAPKSAAKVTPKKSAPKKAAEPAGQAAYDKALKLVLAGKDEPGRSAMEAFLSSNTKSPLAANAQYWIGETWYHQKRYAEAVVAFKKVHQEHPKHSKAPAALLKIGYSYAALGDKDNARFYLGVLTQDYPKSELASLARDRLKGLK